MIHTNILKKKTLNMAMRGQLTKQSVNDGPAVPMEYNVGFLSNEEAPYSIPTNWRWVRIRDVIEKDVGGGTPSKAIEEYWTNGNIPWATVKDFSAAERGILEDTIDHITESGLKNSAAHLVDADAIVLCMRMELGKIVRFSRPMAINQDLRAIWLKPYVLEDFFVYFYSTLRISGHGMTVSGVKKNDLFNLPFPVPPYAEQIRIVGKLKSIFTEIENIDNAYQEYRGNILILKSKLIEAGIRGHLTNRLPDDDTAEHLYLKIKSMKDNLIKTKQIKKEKPLPNVQLDKIPFAIPKEWKWVFLQDCTVLNPRNRINDDTEVSFIPMTLIGDGYNNRFSYEIRKWGRVKRGYTHLMDGDIGIAKITPSFENRKSAVFEGMKNGYGAATTELHVIRVLPGTINAKYLLYVFKSDYFIGCGVKTYSGDVGQQRIDPNFLKHFLIPLPPRSEQDRIVNLLDKAFSLLDTAMQ